MAKASKPAESQTDPGEFPVRGFAESAVWLGLLIFVFVGIYLISQTWLGDLAGQMTIWPTLVLGAALILACYFDIRSYILPDLITLPLIVGGLVWHLMEGNELVLPILGVILGYGLIAGLRLLWLKVRHVEAIGLGDAKLLAAGGASCGALALPMILLVGSGLGLLAALISILRTKNPSGLNMTVPFGPFLATGIWAAWCLSAIYSI